MYLTVLVPAYNRSDVIERCLKSIKSSSFGEFELIVVDDGSSDETALIAQSYADRVIKFPENVGENAARIEGFKAAAGEIIVSVDSDVVIKSDTLTKIADYFNSHKDIDALTGLFSKSHPNKGFFSQYKNIYMHYIFRKLPDRVTFLFGSIFAIRKTMAYLYAPVVDGSEDTAFGQQITQSGKEIAFLRDLEVEHLKKYSFFSFIKNDFTVPFNWTKIFIKYKGWQQLGRNKTGFAHSPREQLLSVMIAPAVIIFTVLTRGPVVIIALALWAALNYNFFSFLKKERGLLFLILSIPLTFLDNIIMASGILLGLIEICLLRK